MARVARDIMALASVTGFVATVSVFAHLVG
jgi:hypothetical protein